MSADIVLSDWGQGCSGLITPLSPSPSHSPRYPLPSEPPLLFVRLSAGQSSVFPSSSELKPVIAGPLLLLNCRIYSKSAQVHKCTCSSAPSSAYNPALSTIPSIIHAMPRIICALLGIIICALCTVEYNNLCTSEYNNPPRDKDRTEPCNLLAGSAAAH